MTALTIDQKLDLIISLLSKRPTVSLPQECKSEIEERIDAWLANTTRTGFVPMKDIRSECDLDMGRSTMLIVARVMVAKGYEKSKSGSQRGFKLS